MNYKKKTLIILSCLILFPSSKTKADISNVIIGNAMAAALGVPMVLGGILALGIGAGVAYGIIKLNRHLNQQDETITPTIVSNAQGNIKTTRKPKRPRQTLFSKLFNKNKNNLSNPAIV